MRSSTPLDDLIALGKHRWAVPLLADLAAHKGARFVELVNRLGLARESLVRTIEGAIENGWVMRNPGHGHPLRPEYVLTAQGEALAVKASGIAKAQAKIGIEPASLTRWSLPIVRSIADGHHRFNELARAIPPATPRALSQSLRSLASYALVERELVDEWPPASVYRLTKGGLILARAA